MRTRKRLAAVLTLAVGPGALLAGCGSDDEPAASPAETAVSALARALTTGEFDALEFTRVTAPEALADYGEVIEGMGERRPQVTPGEVDEQADDATATATLHWSWPLTDDDQWSYDAPVDLRRVDGEWQVVWGHQVVEPSLNAASVLDAVTVAGHRGDILGAGGAKLVTERPVVEVGIDRTLIKGKAAAVDSARRLAALVGIRVAPFVKAVQGSGDKAFIQAIVYRSDEVPENVGQNHGDIPGVRLLPAQLPLAPTRGFAAPILGTVGPVTADLIKEHPDTYRVGDEVGLSGLQARYDDRLRGTSAVEIDAVGSDGKRRTITTVGGGDGESLELTLDRRLQTLAEGLLADVGPASALVAIRPSDGAILAAANGPGNNGQNLATFGQYAPGSTFKSVSSLALLRSGVTPDTTVDCSRTVDVDGRDFENYDDYPVGALGRIPFRTAIANSCNTAVIAERGRLGRTTLADAAASLGFGVDHDLGFPAYFGQVPAPETETEAAADLIGQGRILASPMAMATVMASIQQGALVVPRLVTSVDVSPPDDAEPLGRSEARQLQDLLRGVVTSGSGRLLADLPGAPVRAKTGTAEFDDDGTIRTHAWMIAGHGDLAVAVFVGLGASGSGVAGPIIKAFLQGAPAR